MKRILIAFIILVVASGCGKPDDSTERQMAVEESYILMSRGDCQGAINKLTSVPPSDTDAKYLQAKALAYACRAGYSTVKLFGTDIDKFATAPSFINGLALFSTSSLRDELDDKQFNDMQTAIDTLLYAGGLSSTQQPSSSKRGEVFGTEDLGEIDALLTYMILVQLGMYFQYYGNIDVTGTKGAGAGTNDCLISYNNAAVDAFLDGNVNTGSCNNAADIGHPDMMDGAEADISRACRGIVLFNQLFDVFGGVISAAGSDLLGGGWTDDIEAAKDALLVAAPGLSILSELNYDQCVADAANDDEIEAFFAYVFETAFK